MSPITIVCALALAASLFGCSKQQEGERCDLNSGNLDCDTGLICRSGDQLNIGVGTGFALCCPPDGVPPTVNACTAGAELPDEPNTPVPALDGGPDAG